jgi:hypothetical protein
MFDGVEDRTLCRPVKFLNTDLDKPFLYGPRFVHWGFVTGTKGPTPNHEKQPQTIIPDWYSAMITTSLDSWLD